MKQQMFAIYNTRYLRIVLKMKPLAMYAVNRNQAIKQAVKKHDIPQHNVSTNHRLSGNEADHRAQGNEAR